MLENLQKNLKKLGSIERKKNAERFFKTGVGQYGEGDVFVGATVPECREVAKKYLDLSLVDIKKLLYSKIHEERLISLFILVHQFEKGDKKIREKVYKFYLNNAKQVNNWDLVDTSAHKIVGAYLLENPEEKKILEKLANSKNLWERRISIISTFQFIKTGELDEAFKVAEMLMNDKHDPAWPQGGASLIHKAVGWMLREVGKKDKNALVSFLNKHKHHMPRTALRYAIERFPEAQRKKILYG